MENSQSIIVHFFDGTEKNADVVGVDRMTDIAVIRVNGIGRARVATLGDSDRLRVGEWVVAIGSPRGLNWTVTAGIVSATHRLNVGMDAHRPLGFHPDRLLHQSRNSGGPLLILKGEVIGMNSLIWSQIMVLKPRFHSNLVKEIAETLD